MLLVAGDVKIGNAVDTVVLLMGLVEADGANQSNHNYLTIGREVPPEIVFFPQWV